MKKREGGTERGRERLGDRQKNTNTYNLSLQTIILTSHILMTLEESSPDM